MPPEHLRTIRGEWLTVAVRTPTNTHVSQHGASTACSWKAYLLEELLPQANYTPETAIVRSCATCEGERALDGVSKARLLVKLLLHIHLWMASRAACDYFQSEEVQFTPARAAEPRPRASRLPARCSQRSADEEKRCAPALASALAASAIGGARKLHVSKHAPVR